MTMQPRTKPSAAAKFRLRLKVGLVGLSRLANVENIKNANISISKNERGHRHCPPTAIRKGQEQGQPPSHQIPPLAPAALPSSS
jgi:hypothetical protein